jgi:hypothetical protein
MRPHQLFFIYVNYSLRDLVAGVQKCDGALGKVGGHFHRTSRSIHISLQKKRMKIMI